MSRHRKFWLGAAILDVFWGWNVAGSMVRFMGHHVGFIFPDSPVAIVFPRTEGNIVVRALQCCVRASQCEGGRLLISNSRYS